MGEKQKKEIVSKTSLETFPGTALNRCDLILLKLNKIKSHLWDEEVDHYVKRHMIDTIEQLKGHINKTNEDLVSTKKKLNSSLNIIRRLETWNM